MARKPALKTEELRKLDDRAYWDRVNGLYVGYTWIQNRCLAAAVPSLELLATKCRAKGFRLQQTKKPHTGFIRNGKKVTSC